MEITSGIISGASKVVIYGPEGIGKSTLASKFPEPLFIDVEGGTNRLSVRRLPSPEKWEDILEEVSYVTTHPDVCKTLVLDTADAAETLCNKGLLLATGKKGIEDFGYGKGYVYLKEKYNDLLDRLKAVVAIGINVVVIGHAELKKFEQPDEMGAYDRWALKLTKHNAPILKEWADAVLFCNYKSIVIKTGEKTYKAAGEGKRVMYASHHNCWDAKNRFGWPDEMPMDFAPIAHSFEPVEPQKSPQTQLLEIMEQSGVTEWDIQNLSVNNSNWGVSDMTPISEYSDALCGFLIRNWLKALAKIKAMKETQEQEIPFNV